jgi:hypothetical protein
MPSNSFLEQMKRAREAKQPAPHSKPVSEMSDAELEAEGKRLRAELRRTNEDEIHLARAELDRRRTTLGAVLRSKPRRPRWK